jgi:hypothetical protein
MKKIIVVILVSMACYHSLQAQVIIDSKAEIRNITSFKAINIEDALEVYLTQSTEDGLAVSTTDERRQIITEVKNEILYISVRNNGGANNWSDKQRLKVYISFKKINQIEVKGACNVNLTGNVQLDELSIKLSGATDFKSKGKIVVNKMAIDLSGASDLYMQGSSNFLLIDVSGASKVKADEFVTDVCDIKCSGASDIYINANKTILAQISGASDLRYKGSAYIKEIKSTGASSIKRMQ